MMFGAEYSVYELEAADGLVDLVRADMVVDF
jgi:hypothetical protein